MVNIQCHSFVQVIGFHSFIPLVVFPHSFLPRSSSWFGYHLAIIYSGCWVVHLSFIHTLIIHQLVYISFIRSFVRPLASDSFVDIVHELLDVELYRGGGGDLV